MNVFDYNLLISPITHKSGKPTDAKSRIRSTQQEQTGRSTIQYKHDLEQILQPTNKRSTALAREVDARELEIDEDYRHWSPESQSYTTAEVLLQYLSWGWECMNHVTVKTSRCGHRRFIELYSFEIAKGHERLCVPVVSNPVILRLIHERKLNVIQSFY